MECTSCGATLTADCRFCPTCGAQAPDPPVAPYASTLDLDALRTRLDDLESRVERHAEESAQMWSRIPILEDAERRHRRILNSSSLYTDMFGMRLVTMVGYGLLSGVVVSAILLVVALATGVLHW